MLYYIVANLAAAGRFLQNFFGWFLAPRAMIRVADVQTYAFYFKVLNFYVVCVLISVIAGKALDAAYAPNVDAGLRLANATAFLGSITPENLGEWFGAGAGRVLSAMDFVTDNLVIAAGLAQASLSALFFYLVMKVPDSRYRFRYALMTVLPMHGVMLVLTALLSVVYVSYYMHGHEMPDARLVELHQTYFGQGGELRGDVGPCLAAEAAGSQVDKLSVECRAQLTAIDRFGHKEPWAFLSAIILSFTWFLIAPYMITRVGFKIGYGAQIGAVLFALLTLFVGPFLLSFYRALRKLF